MNTKKCENRERKLRNQRMRKNIKKHEKIRIKMKIVKALKIRKI